MVVCHENLPKLPILRDKGWTLGRNRNNIKFANIYQALIFCLAL